VNYPDFFILGFMKCATTSLHTALAGHPDIFMSSLKEPGYFIFKDGELPISTVPNVAAYTIDSAEDYSALFNPAAPEQLKGESSVMYATERQARENIRKTLPNAKFIVCLRDPVQRARSHILNDQIHGREPLDYGEAVRAALDEWDDHLLDDHALNWQFGRASYLYAGHYAHYIQKYMGEFHPPQFHFVLFEDLTQRFGQIAPGLLEFLGVDPRVTLSMNQENPTEKKRFPQLHQMLVSLGAFQGLKRMLPGELFRKGRALTAPLYRKPVYPVSHPIEDELREFYRPSILALQGVIDRDLSHWLSSPE
jgi:hypothetical protein